MFKVSIIVLSFVVSVYSDAQSVAQGYCNLLDVCPKFTSIACKYTKDPTIKCKGNLITLPRVKITRWHNIRRNLVALGKIPRFNKCKRMASMRWNKQLAQMARYYVMKCRIKRDKCHNTRLFKHSGQNVFKYVGNDLTYSQIFLKAISSWFSQKRYCSMRQINKFFPGPKGKPCGVFTAMVKYNSNFIGCAASTFRRGKRRTVIFACNYASNNFVGKGIYFVGRTASQCRTGRNVGLRGLCSQRERFSSTW